jgi:hypothetical protein
MPAEKFEMWKKKAAANKPKPNQLKSMILMKIWMVILYQNKFDKYTNTLQECFFMTITLN